MGSWRAKAASLAVALALAGMPGNLAAQEPDGEVLPPLTVPSLPPSSRASRAIEEAAEDATGPVIQATPFGMRQANFPFVPFMLGDLSGPLANPMTDIKASEGESPIPMDRGFYRFNMYSNLDPSRYQAVSLPYKRVNLYANVFGIEKTVGDLFSLGFRMPINGIQALSRGVYYVKVPGKPQPVPVPAPPTYNSIQFGNVSALFKAKFAESIERGYLVSGGVVLTLPTATTQRIDPGPSTAAIFQPFLGYVYARDRLYAQGFTSMTVPLVTVQSIILFQDIGIGYWLLRNESQTAFLTGAAPTFEFHLNVPLQGPERFSSVLNQSGSLPFNTQFNLTFGGTFEFAHRATLGLGFVVPTVGPIPFDCEFLAHFNVRF